MRQILVVDDEIGIRELLSEILSDEGYDVQLAENAGAARAFRTQNRPDLVLLDIWMPDTDGITLLKEWASTGQLTMPVVMMSGHGTIDTAVRSHPYRRLRLPRKTHCTAEAAEPLSARQSPAASSGRRRRRWACSAAPPWFRN